MEKESKPIHAKPSLYAFYFELAKAIGLKYGYNVVLHGSMNRDLDLIAIPWNETIGDDTKMIEEIAIEIGGKVMMWNQCKENMKGDMFTTNFHGRKNYVININRDIEYDYNGLVSKEKDYADPQYYIDFSVIPHQTNESNEKHKSINEQVEILKDTLEEMMTGFDTEENRMDFILDICNGYKKRVSNGKELEG